jgi:predicted nucleotidyltransferase
MNRAEAVARLRDHADAIKAMGATSLYLFESVAEDTAGASSDLDLFIDTMRPAGSTPLISWALSSFWKAPWA